MINHPLLESSENRYGYPLERKYAEYSSDMFFLFRLSKSVLEILAYNYEEIDVFCFLVVDFETKRYSIEPSPLVSVSRKKRSLTSFFRVKDLSFVEFSEVYGTPYDLYLLLKLYYDNKLRSI